MAPRARATAKKPAAAGPGKVNPFAQVFGANAKAEEDKDPKAENEDEDEERKQRADESDDDYAKRMKALDEKEDKEAKAADEDDEDDEDEEKDEKAKAAAFAAGAKAESARWAAVLSNPATVGKGATACALLADETLAHLSADQIMGVLNKTPAAEAPAAAVRPGLASRMHAAAIPVVAPGGAEAAAAGSANATAAAIVAAAAKARGEKVPAA